MGGDMIYSYLKKQTIESEEILILMELYIYVYRKREIVEG